MSFGFSPSIAAMLATHCAGLRHHLGGGVEGSQATQLNGYALRHQLGQTVHDLHQHALDHCASVDGAVIHHVLCEASQRQRLLLVHLGVVLAEAATGRNLVLSQVNSQCNFLYCHNVKNRSCVFCGLTPRAVGTAVQLKYRCL